MLVLSYPHTGSNPVLSTKLIGCHSTSEEYKYQCPDESQRNTIEIWCRHKLNNKIMEDYKVHGIGALEMDQLIELLAETTILEESL